MGQTSANPYSSSSIAAYNSTPPSDDGATTTANKVEWAKHKTKLADPIKTLSEAIDSGMTTAGALLVNTATGVRNQISGSVGFAWGTATIADDSITPDTSAVQIGTEGGATQDTLQNMGVGSVYDGAVLTIKALSATEEILVIHATSTAATHASANIYLPGESFLIDDDYKALTLRYDSQTASGWVQESPSVNQANQTAIEAETNEDTYIPPDLLKHHPGVAKCWIYVERSAGTPVLGGEEYNMDSVTDDGAAETLCTITTDFSHDDYVVCGGQDTNAVVHANTLAVGSFKLHSYNLNDGTDLDTADHSASCFGDQA